MNLTNWFQHNPLLAFVIIVGVSYLLTRFGTILLEVIIRRTVGRIGTDLSEKDVHKRQKTLIGMLGAIFRLFVWLTTGFTILGLLGINLGPLLAGASVLGVALGFGSQSIIKDMLSGLFIILENQYRVGDVVDINDAAGSVEQITIRSTIIRGLDGNVHYIPNGTITHVINQTMGYSGINFTLTVPADTNVDELADIINTVGKKLAKEEGWKAKILEAPKFLNVSDFTETTLDARIIGKTQPAQQWSVTGELRKRLLIELKRHNIAASKGSPNDEE
jgi:small conductance mechanosensitive channel